jgi:hypothetical protein
MKKLIGAVLSLALLFSIAAPSYAIPEEDSAIIRINLTGETIVKASGLGLVGFGLYRAISTAVVGAGHGKMFLDGLGNIGSGFVNMGNILLPFLRAGLIMASIAGVVYAIDWSLEHKISKRISRALD